MVRVARFSWRFSQRWQGIRQGMRTRALICSCMLRANRKGEFPRVEKQDFNFVLWMNVKLQFLRLFWLMMATLVSYCFYFFGEFAKVFEGKVRRVQVWLICREQRVHFQDLVSVFNCQRSVDKDFFRDLWCWDAAKKFHQRQKGANIMCVSSR